MNVDATLIGFLTPVVTWQWNMESIVVNGANVVVKAWKRNKKHTTITNCQNSNQENKGHF